LEILRDYQKKDRRISILTNPVNIGAAASRNKAILVAKGETLVFLDNDTEVKKSWLDELLKTLMNNDQIGAVQALILDYKKRDLIQMAGGLLIPQTGWIIPFHQWKKYSKIKNKLKEQGVVAISAALAVKRKVIQKIGGFDEKEAVYTEDLDLCWRIWIAGYKVVLSPQSVIFHYTKSVEERGEMKASYKQIYFHLAKNSFRSIIKNYEIGNVLKYLPVSIFINTGRGFFILFSKRKPDALVGSLEAIVWLFFNFSGTLKARTAVQVTRKFSDKYLMRNIFTTDNLIQVYNKYFTK
jgi:GT2 family glycosyltransferase